MSKTAEEAKRDIQILIETNQKLVDQINETIKHLKMRLIEIDTIENT